MALYHFRPPVTDEDGKPFPPLVFESSGDEKCVFAHRYWKKVQQVYEIEKLWDKPGVPMLNNDGTQRVHKGKRSVWVLDEDKNKLLDAGKIGPPENTIDLSKICCSLLAQRKYRKWTPYLISQEALYREEKKNFETIKKTEFEKFETARSELERERAELERARLELKKVRESLQKQAQDEAEDAKEEVKRGNQRKAAS